MTPTIGRDAALRKVLDALDAQQARDFEVLVVADAKHPDPASVDAAVQGRGYPVRALRADRPGASAARNRAIAAAQGELLLFLDDDIVPRPDLIAQHLAWHDRHPDPQTAVLGLVVWSPETRVTNFMRWLERGIQFDFDGAVGDVAGWERFYSCNLSVKRSAVEAVGGFDEERLPYCYEDLDLGKRIHDAHGLELLLNRNAVGEHLHQLTFESWHGRAAHLATVERAFVEKHPDVPPFFHEQFATAASRPPASGRGRHLLWLFRAPRGRVGEYVWGSADMWYRQQLAPSFLAVWDAADEAAPAP